MATNLAIPAGMDPEAVNLARAMREQESGGDYTKMGDNNTSAGAYQWSNGSTSPLTAGQIPANFQSDAKQYGLDPTDFSPKNQDMVMYTKIKALKDAGKNVLQIAALHNGGDENRYDPNYVTPGGLPSQGTGPAGAYDVPAYVKAVNDRYQQLKAQTANAPTLPVGPQPNPSLTGIDNSSGVGGDAPAQSSDNTLNDAVAVGKGLVSGTVASGQDIAAAIGGNTMAKTFQALPEADQKYLTTLIQLRNNAATAQNKPETDHFNSLIKSYKASDGESITQVFPALNKSTEQVLGDFASMGLETVGGAGAVEGLAGLAGVGAKTGAEVAAKTVGQKVLRSALTSGGYGAGFGVAGGMQNNESLGGVAESGAVGAGLGAVVGAGTELAGAGLQRAFGGSLSAEDIAKVKPEDVKNLSPRDQKEWHTQNAKTSVEAAKQAGIQSVEDAKAKISDMSTQLANTNETQRVALKEPFKQLMKNSSQEYLSLTGEATQDNPALSKTITTSDLGAKIDSKFENDPDMATSLKADLGIKPPTPPVAGETPPPEPKLTNQEILDKARAIMSDVSKSAKSGGSVYSSSEYQAMKKYSFLMETLGDNGVDMSKANQFWREWTPVRERGIRAIQPFDESNVKKGNLGSTLNKATVTPATPAQAGAKLDAQNFMNELETRLKLPKGSLTSDTQDLMDQLEKAKISKGDAQKVATKVQAQIREEVRQKKWDIQSKIEQRKKILGWVKLAGGALGIGSAVFGGVKVLTGK